MSYDIESERVRCRKCAMGFRISKPGPNGGGYPGNYDFNKCPDCPVVFWSVRATTGRGHGNVYGVKRDCIVVGVMPQDQHKVNSAI